MESEVKLLPIARCCECSMPFDRPGFSACQCCVDAAVSRLAAMVRHTPAPSRQETHSDDAVAAFAIDVEKLLLAKLGRPWTPGGISINELIDQLAAARQESIKECVDRLEGICLSLGVVEPIQCVFELQAIITKLKEQAKS